MNESFAQAVIDLLPWANGQGFAHTDVWWRYVRSRSETERLELLILVATLSSDVCARLLAHDAALLECFALTEATRHQLEEIHALSLEGFARCLHSNQFTLGEPDVSTNTDGS